MKQTAKDDKKDVRVTGLWEVILAENWVGKEGQANNENERRTHWEVV